MDQQTIKRRLRDGSVNPNWLCTLDANQLSDWVRNILKDRDPIFPSWACESREETIRQAFKDSGGEVKESIKQCLVNFVSDMALNKDSEWRGKGSAEGAIEGDFLLLTASGICDKTTFVPLIVQMIYSGEFIGMIVKDEDGFRSSDIHARLLQQMTRFRVHAPFQFWQQQTNLNPELYLGPAMRGADDSGFDCHLLLEGIEQTKEIEDVVRLVDELIDLANRHKELELRTQPGKHNSVSYWELEPGGGLTCHA